MRYYVFETFYMGRFAIEAPTYEEAIKSMFANGFVLIGEDEDWSFIGEATLEEVDAEGLDVL